MRHDFGFGVIGLDVIARGGSVFKPPCTTRQALENVCYVASAPRLPRDPAPRGGVTILNGMATRMRTEIASARCWSAHEGTGAYGEVLLRITQDRHLEISDVSGPISDTDAGRCANEAITRFTTHETIPDNATPAEIAVGFSLSQSQLLGK
jgi:hypothetical protein